MFTNLSFIIAITNKNTYHGYNQNYNFYSNCDGMYELIITTD